jgi:hypothetical protein
VPVTKEPRTLQVALTSDESEIVVGTDHGSYRVFERKGGNLVDVLRIGPEVKWAQTVAVRPMSMEEMRLTESTGI